MSITAANPIGIFDSGIGGLTVAKAVHAGLPAEHIIYFGDTARVPYGSKSQVMVRKYAQDDTALLMKYQPKMIIVACNTVSALALDVVEETGMDVPVLGVLDAGAELAVSYTRNKRIGVIGTRATVASNAYPCAITMLDPDIEVYSSPCPLFVPLAEEGCTDHPAAELIAKEYLGQLLDQGIDTLVLGCTHYPILKKLIGKIIGPDITIVDSADAVACKAREMFDENGLLNNAENTTMPHLLVSDLPQKFKSLCELFLGREVPDVELVEV